MTKHGPLDMAETWPHHFCNLSGIPEYLNDAEGNGSNIAIFRRSQEFLKNLSPEQAESTLAIIQLTVPFRFEYPKWANFQGQLKKEYEVWENAFWHKYNINTQNESVSLTEDSTEQDRYAYNSFKLGWDIHHRKTRAWNSLTESYEAMIIANAISNLFANKGADCYFVTFCWNDPELQKYLEDVHDLTTVNWLFHTPSKSNMFNCLDQTKQNEWAIPNDGHPNSVGNQQIAKYFFQQISKLL
jgi:hypothetical protein